MKRFNPNERFITTKTIKSLPNYFKDRYTDQLLGSADLWDSAYDYSRVPTGYAETDNMTQEEAIEFLDKWFHMVRITKYQDAKEYRNLMNRVLTRITTAWLEDRCSKDIGRTIARLHYHLNK